MTAHSIIDVANLQALGSPHLSRELRVTTIADPQDVVISVVSTRTNPLRPAAQDTTCRMTDADLNAARRAAQRATLTKAYALQAAMDGDGIVSLIAAPTDTNSGKPIFMVSRPSPSVVSVARLDQAAFEDLGELGTVTEAVRMVCHHARYVQARTMVEA